MSEKRQVQILIGVATLLLAACLLYGVFYASPVKVYEFSGDATEPSQAKIQDLSSELLGSADMQNKESSENASKPLHKVNINEASLLELVELPGIGPATAEKIIAYREENGPFSEIEEIKAVNGIGEKKFLAIKEQITVG